MNTNYYRVTAYHPTKDLSIIMDSNGLYDALWKFSSSIVSKGFDILEVSNSSSFLEGNIVKAEFDSNSYILRAVGKGRPGNVVELNSNETYHAVKVGEKVYVPDKSKLWREQA